MPRFTGQAGLDFSLADTQGQRVSLADYRGSRHVVLVFNRGLT
jgi:peroxiredoxin